MGRGKNICFLPWSLVETSSRVKAVQKEQAAAI